MADFGLVLLIGFAFVAFIAIALTKKRRAEFRHPEEERAYWQHRGKMMAERDFYDDSHEPPASSNPFRRERRLGSGLNSYSKKVDRIVRGKYKF